jgi:hypothetical protein
VSPLYAWPTWSEPWALQVSDVVVDGIARPEAVDTAQSRVHVAGDRWTRLTCGVTAQAPDEQGSPVPASVHVLVSAPRTQSRWVVPLERRDGVWAASVELPRELVVGAVEVTAEVIGEVDGRVRLQGRSAPWTIVVDAGQAPVPPGGPPFPMVWLDFGADGAPAPARRDPDVPAVLDMSGAPVLYLNDAMTGLRLLLNAEHAKCARRMARDLVGSAVAARATTTLVRAAVADVVSTAAEDGPPSPPSDPTRRQALEAVAGAMTSVSDLSDLCERVMRVESGPTAERAALWSEIDAAVDRLCGVTAAIAEVALEGRFG